MAASCVACGEARPAPHFPGLSIVRCGGCGLVYADPAVYPVDAPKLYGEDYFHGREYSDYVRDRPVAELNFRALIRRMRPRSPGGRLFEIGCAYGFFLNQCRGIWDGEGIDVSGEAVRYARETLGVRARVGDFLDAEVGSGFDVFCLWDTLEHLARPDLYVEKAARCLKPGGILYLTTGDIGSLLARLQGPRWRLVHPPTHLFYFSRETVRRMLARFGLEVVEASSQGYYRSLDSMLLQMSLPRKGWMGGVLKSLSRFSLARTPLYLNLFDIMFVAARVTKKDAGFVTHY